MVNPENAMLETTAVLRAAVNKPKQDGALSAKQRAST